MVIDMYKRAPRESIEQECTGLMQEVRAYLSMTKTGDHFKWKHESLGDLVVPHELSVLSIRCKPFSKTSPDLWIFDVMGQIEKDFDLLDNKQLDDLKSCLRDMWHRLSTKVMGDVAADVGQMLHRTSQYPAPAGFALEVRQKLDALLAVLGKK